ncbi:glycerophosphodiester phosphodiesterase [Butyricicoccus sp.]|uniref:glycerophosphodiester phosphodiesterase n=1 Tax=Butyricicoccus sp. TaxID=2049021 RepID=UPI003F17B877
MTTLLTAHSGADETPENSLEFIRYVLATEADALEIDVRRQTRSGTLVLSHDELCVRGQPLLRQAMELVSQHPSMCINCDLKEPGLEQQVFRLADEMQIVNRLIFSGTVDPAALTEIPIPREHVYLNIEEQIPELYGRCRQDAAYALRAAEKICDICSSYGIRTVNVFQGLVTDPFLEILNSREKDISVWTVDEETRLAYFLSHGVRNITTRRLTAALSVRQEKGTAI